MFKKNYLIKKLNVSDQILLALITSIDINEFESFYELERYVKNCVSEFQSNNNKHFWYMCDTDWCLRGMVRIVIYRMMYTQNEKNPIAEFVKSDPLAWENMAINQGGVK